MALIWGRLGMEYTDLAAGLQYPFLVQMRSRVCMCVWEISGMNMFTVFHSYSTYIEYKSTLCQMS